MYRTNLKLETADMKLRLFVCYCREMPELWEDIQECKEEIKTNNTKEMRIKLNYAIKRYLQHRNFIESIRDNLVTLTQEELSMLCDRYERNLTLREIGDIRNYSYMNISRCLDKILIKF